MFRKYKVEVKNMTGKKKGIMDKVKGFLSDEGDDEDFAKLKEILEC